MRLLVHVSMHGQACLRSRRCAGCQLTPLPSAVLQGQLWFLTTPWVAAARCNK